MTKALHGRRILSCGSIGLAVFLSTLAWPGSALAKPKSSECNGLTGSARGLCNAYCKAQNCPAHPDTRSCSRLRRNFNKRTGSETFPCDRPGATATPGAATPTVTPVAATATATPVVGATATQTPVVGATATQTPVVGATATQTPVVGATATQTPVVGATATQTPVVEATPTATGTEVVGATPTQTPVVEATPTATATEVPTPSPTTTAAGAACPDIIEFEGTAGAAGILDTGWTGQAHDATVVDEGVVTVGVTGCEGTVEPCGVCDLNGPVPNIDADIGDIDNQRCTNNTSVKCTDDTSCFQQCVGGANDGVACTVVGDCPGGGTLCSAAGTCEFYFGTLLPLAAGGVSTCVSNQVVGSITGTANLDDGTAASNVQLRSTVFNGILLSQPCPNCNGDATPNDGILGGTCTAGPRNGLPCDINGSSPNIAFGSTSLDCPANPGAVIASLPIDLSNTTGIVTKTLTADSPRCRAAGFSAFKCQCDVCNGLAKKPCDENADCLAAPVDGDRCGAGGVGTGAGTRPNECDDLDGDLANDCGALGSGSPGPNDRACVTGPSEQFCTPIETFRGCSSNIDCTFAGDTCSLLKQRECFDNGVVGDVVTATGVADPPVGGEADPTLAALFCIGPTIAPAVNSAAGLPGLGRVELPGHTRNLLVP